MGAKRRLPVMRCLILEVDCSEEKCWSSRIGRNLFEVKIKIVIRFRGHSLNEMYQSMVLKLFDQEGCVEHGSFTNNVRICAVSKSCWEDVAICRTGGAYA